MRDKALDEITATLFPAADRVIITRPDMARAAEPEEVARVAVPPGADSSKITLARGACEALKAARAQTPPLGLICITGSLYLIGELQRALLEERAAYPRTSSEH
jgi:dihydrofolate synthase/folylpolyglutamate synthase